MLQLSRGAAPDPAKGQCPLESTMFFKCFHSYLMPQSTKDEMGLGPAPIPSPTGRGAAFAYSQLFNNNHEQATSIPIPPNAYMACMWCGKCQ